MTPTREDALAALSRRLTSLPAPGPGAGLIERLGAGDENAAEAVIRGCAGPLLAIARRLLIREEDAREAVLEATLAALRLIRRNGSGANLPERLHRLVIEVALGRFRDERGQNTALDGLLPRFGPDGRHAAPIEEWPAAVRPELQGGGARVRVRTAVGSLPLPYRAALVLIDVEEMSLEQAALILDLPPRVVKDRLHRARMALRTQLVAILGPLPEAEPSLRRRIDAA